MPLPPRTFTCQVLTLQGTPFTGEAVGVVFPGLDGLVGVLARRATLVSALGCGPLMVHAPHGKDHEFFIAGGFAQARHNVLTVLPLRCEPLADIDPEEAFEEIEHAIRMPRQPPQAAETRRWALQIARTRFNLVQRYRLRKGFVVRRFEE